MGKDVPVDEKTYEILETRNVLSRIYENPKGEQIHLLLVGSRKDRRVAHPPEVCYLSYNFIIVDDEPMVKMLLNLVFDDMAKEKNFNVNDYFNVIEKQS
jgi:hypothetical protein